MSKNRLFLWLRMRFGMRWRGHFPPFLPIFRAILACFLAFLVLFFHNLVQNLREKDRKIEQITAEKAQFVQDLLDCWAGKLMYSYPNGKGGFGKTVILCKKAEEFDV